MSLAKLPSDVKGEWIWKDARESEIDSYAFFRREFALDQIPTSAEFWVAANSNYHVYINGRHFCRGPHPSGKHSVSVGFYEAAFCLQYGRNVVTVLVHNDAVSRYANSYKQAAFWCQMNVDGKPAVFTDTQWIARDADCFLRNSPRISSADGFVERVDLRKYPVGWNETEFKPDDAWHAPVSLGPVLGGRWQLTTLPEVERASDLYNFLNLVIYGTAEPHRAFTYVDYRRASERPGVYVAETFVQSGAAADDLAFQFFCDDPFKLYINHKLVLSEGEGQLDNWSDPSWGEPKCHGQDHIGIGSGFCKIRKGANRIRIVQLVGENSSGASLIFPEVEAGGFRFARGKDSISMPGWTVCGPLNVPFSQASDKVSLEGKAQDFFFANEPGDTAAYLISHAFHVDEAQDEGIPIDEVDLESGQYMILELEKYTRGVPSMAITASEGDIIDIVYGDALEGQILSPVRASVRKTYTIIARDGMTEWHGVAAHGMQYMMIFCRHASAQVSISEIGVRRIQLNFREPASFTCSDELMNQIWEVGQNTLLSTYDSVFLNAGGQQEYQFLADAMIQSLTSMHLFGSADFSERALRDFAMAQYETGEMPVVAPGDYFVRLLDAMLLWPIWLSRHFQYTGRKEFVQEMLPHLESLLLFFEEQAGEHGVVLGNQDPPFTNDCIIDYDESIDRKGVNTALNGIYCYSLLKAGWIYEQLGDGEKMKYCGKLAAEIASSVRELTWSEEKGLFADGWYNGKPSKKYSLQSNIIALLSGIAPQEKYTQIFKKIFIDYAPFQNLETDPQFDNPYFKFFLLDMAYALGHREWATDFMRYYWGCMIQNGATTWWERFCPELQLEEINSESLCHGYGCSANYFIIAEVLGIRPVDPGYYQIYFDPHLTAVEWATASIPTPHGHIKLDWRFLETGQLEVTIDASYPLEVVPQLDKNVASDTVLKVGESVSILS